MLAFKEDISTPNSEILRGNQHTWEDGKYFVYLLHDGKTDLEVCFPLTCNKRENYNKEKTTDFINLNVCNLFICLVVWTLENLIEVFLKDIYNLLYFFFPRL